MAIEPKGKTHDSLRAYAQKRRAQSGEPFELQAGGRRLLQEEVVRTYHQPPVSRGMLPILWPRLLMSGLGVAVVLAVAAIWLRSDHEQDVRLAKAEERDRLVFNSAPAANQPAPAQAPDHGLRDRVSRFQVGDAESSMAGAAASRPLKEGKTASKSSLEVPALQNAADSGLSYGLTLADKPASYNAPALPASGPAQDKDRGLAAAGTTAVRAYSKPAEENELLRRTEAVAELARRTGEESLEKAGAATPAALASGVNRFGGGMQTANQQPTGRYNFATSASNVAAKQLPNQAQMQFRQLDQRGKYRQNLNSPPTLNVLNNFEWQQNGANVKIVDEDGSVYAGTVLATATPQAFGGIGGGAAGFGGNRALSRSAALAPQAPAAKPETQLDALAQKNEALGDKVGVARVEAQNAIALKMDNTSQAVSFRAAGTNRTLNQVVVFTGVFEPPEEAPAAPGLPISNSSRIVGQASVGPKSQVRIEAQQAAP